jgi:hypothetical protein
MLRALAVSLVGLLAATLAPEVSPDGSPGSPGAGVPLPAGAVEARELTRRLDSLRTVRWIGASVVRVDLPISTVREHFRAEARRRRGPAVGARLREWLERNPDELAKYREFERSRVSDVESGEWELTRIPASDIPFHLGGGETYRKGRFAAQTVEIGFGAISLDDSLVRVQLLSPHPSDDGNELLTTTLIAWIRETRQLPSSAAPDTVDGPETAGIGAAIRGWLVMDQPVGGMVAVTLPGLHRKTLRDVGQSTGVVHSLAGPDRDGRIAYFENRPGEGRHALKTIFLDGSRDQVVFSRPGEAFFELAVGSALALSSTGGRVAFVGKLSRFQTNRPTFPLRIGALEIWDVEKRTGRPLDLFALDRRLSWFPDGRRLAYVELVPLAKAVFPSNSATDAFGDSFRTWEAVPEVRILDVNTGRRVTIHTGWDPVVAADGKSVLVRDADNHWRRADVATGWSQPVRWPGDAGGAIALTADGLVVYWGLPTIGTAPDFTRTFGTALGPRAMKTLKVAELSTQRFETLLPSLDPRRDVSFAFVASH